MASKSARRPQSLISQAQGNLRNVQAANRQRLRDSGILDAPAEAGYPRTNQRRIDSNSADGSSSVVSSSRRVGGEYPGVAQASSSLPRLKSPRSSFSSTAGSLPPRSPSVTSASALSASARSGGIPPRSPSVRSTSSRSGNVSPRRSPAASVRDAEEDFDDDEFDRQLLELEELSEHLARYGDFSRGLEMRPTTGGTSASDSTTAPASSRGTLEANACQEQDLDGNGDVDPLRSLTGAPLAHYEISRMRLPHGCRFETSHGSFAQFFLSVDVTEGPYTPATLVFWIKIFSEYPQVGNFSVRCTKRIFHPCVDASTGAVDVRTEGEVRLPSLIEALLQLVKSPPTSPALNDDAAALLERDPDEFRRKVRLTLNGGEHGGVTYDRVINLTKAAPDKKAPRGSMSEQIQIDLMKLEVLKEEYKSHASAFIQQNKELIENLS
eukprot:TRINITY_DN32567_c0_g1_i1.p1 TRINITY_DN32567_c0_g1~~TRINITY_DN32567_c0_g1_i1.p1  ORF type:complete len:447 (+),score=50.38 TRINITY_DN32567_c0_g1_i1:30-1343(+)